MPRIAPLSAPYAGDVQASFDAIMPPGADPLVLFRTLAASPRHWKKFRAGSLLDRGPLSVREREIVIDRTCALAGCEYEWGVHVAIFAGPASLTDAEVAATVSGDTSAWSDAERALVAAVDALHHRATLSKEEWSGLRAHYVEDQVFEVLLLCGFYRTAAYVANSLALPLKSGSARFGSYG